MRTVSPMDAPDKATEVEIEFEKGDPVALNGKKMSPATLFAVLNDLGRDNGIGRIDLVENRFVGHEVPRCLRNAGRHHPAQPPTGPWSRSRWIVGLRT
jgi:argininosuccinate synthase